MESQFALIVKRFLKTIFQSLNKHIPSFLLGGHHQTPINSNTTYLSYTITTITMSDEVSQGDNYNFSTNSVNSINNDTNRMKIMELFGKIRYLLSLTFDNITLDSSLIKHLNQLITDVRVMEPYLNHAQLAS